MVVTALQTAGLIEAIVTQNVDGLHQRSGAQGVLELHGALDRVLCLGCGSRSTRESLDERLTAANPAWHPRRSAIRPDGDVDLEDVAGFTVLDCLRCGGILKPDVVFFGETVPVERATATFAMLSRANSLLVLGSSLTVMSGYRFVLHARKLELPVAIINQGPTRGDTHARVRVDAPLGEVLTELAAGLQTKLAP